MVKKYFLILVLFCISNIYAVLPNNKRYVSIHPILIEVPRLDQLMPRGANGIPEYSYYIPPDNENLTLFISGQRIQIPLAQYVNRALQEWQRVSREANGGVNLFTIRRESNSGNNVFMRMQASVGIGRNEEAITDLSSWYNSPSPTSLSSIITLYSNPLGRDSNDLFTNYRYLFINGISLIDIANINVYTTILHEIGHSFLMDHPDDASHSVPALYGSDASVTNDDVNIMLSDLLMYLANLRGMSGQRISNIDNIHLFAVDGRALRNLFYEINIPDPNDSFLANIDFGDRNHPVSMGINQGSFSPW